VPSSQYFSLRYAVNEAVFTELNKSGIRLMPGNLMSVQGQSLSADDDETAEDRIL